jgi:hypothetical protein
LPEICDRYNPSCAAASSSRRDWDSRRSSARAFPTQWKPLPFTAKPSKTPRSGRRPR